MIPNAVFVRGAIYSVFSCGLVAALFLPSFAIEAGVEDSNEYLRLITARIKYNWKCKPIYRGSAVVRFEILPDGTVKNVALATSSGDKEEDASCTKSIVDAQPYPPYRNMGRGALKVEFSFAVKGPTRTLYNGVDATEGYVTRGGAKVTKGDPKTTEAIRQYSKKQWKLLLDLGDVLRKFADQASKAKPAERIDLEVAIAQSYLSLHDFSKALSWFQEALDTSTANGEAQDSPRVIALKIGIAKINYEQSRYSECESQVSQLLAVLDKQGEAPSSDLCDLLELKARTLYKLNRAADGDVIFARLRLLKDQTKSLENKHSN